MPTDLSLARGAALPDDDMRAPPRPRRSRSSKKTAAPMRLLDAVAFPRLSTSAVVGCAAFCALMTGVVVNALYLQTDKHRAPLFSAADAPAAAAAPVARLPVREVEAPLPPPRPAIEPPATPAPRPASRETTGSLARVGDGVGALLAAAPDTKPSAKPRAAKPGAQAARGQPTKSVADHRRAAVAAKPKAGAAAVRPVVAAQKDKANPAAVSERISEEMRRKLAAIGVDKGGGAKSRAAPRAAADDEE